MRLSINHLLLAGTVSLASASSNSTTSPGYTCYPHCIASTIPSNESSSLTFGKHYAVLNLDLISGLLASVLETKAGQTFINSTATWINAVHKQNPPPLSIFTRIYFSNSRQPEIGPDVPFAKVSSALGNTSDPHTFVYSAFHVDEAAGDIVLQKTRYYAGAGNGLEEILRAQKIDTVILSGIRTSGVVLNTVYQLFDLDYKVYVIANNTIETPPNEGGMINTAILEGVIPKLPADVITLEQALGALERSGPAVY